MKLKLLAPLLIVLTAVIASVVILRPAPAEPIDTVLVVRNGDSPVSCRIAEYYMAKRDIAKGNLVTIRVQDSSTSAGNENISFDDYTEKIGKPVAEYLEAQKLKDKIKYIVLTKGIPIRITGDSAQGICGQSVDSMLATTALVEPKAVRMGTDEKPFVLIVNKYWRSKEPFSHSKFGGYLVTRLDGYTEADAKALVDRAIAPQSTPIRVLMDAKLKSDADRMAKHPVSVLLPDGTLNQSFALKYEDFDADMARANEIISGRNHVKAELDQTSTFAGSDKPLSIYISWGSNAHKDYCEEVYHSLKFAPRSIAETAVSSSGRTFLPTKDGQSLIADLISQGAAGAKGYVGEPYLFAMASPTVLVDLYTSGRNLAESFYAASRFIGWKDVVIGDPLCQLEVPKGAK